MKTNLLFTLTFIFFTGLSYSQTSIATIESEMVLVEGGSMYIQGRIVTLPSFYSSKFEVTQKLFEEVMGYNIVTWPQVNIHPMNPVGFRADEEPTFYPDFLIFCNELNKMKGLPIRYYKDPDLTMPVTKSDLHTQFDSYEDYSNNSFRLPTATEWQFSYRGGIKSMGFDYSGSNNIYDVAWIYSNAFGTLHNVGQLKSNELGIYDMSGNVAEVIFDTSPSGFVTEQLPTSEIITHGLQCGHIWDGGGLSFTVGGCSVLFEASTTFCKIPGGGIVGLRLFKDKK